MADREKVIVGLKELRSHFHAMAGIASSRQGRTNHIQSTRTIDDALALLKAQEPRVLTAKELDDWLEPVYLEDVFYGGRWALIADFSANWFTFNVTEPGFLKQDEFHVTEYGRKWRCWTSRPTDAQREAEPWVK